MDDAANCRQLSGDGRLQCFLSASLDSLPVNYKGGFKTFVLEKKDSNLNP